MTSLSILFNLNLKYCINNNSQQTITSQRRNNYVIITWLHETLSLAATLLPHEYFPTCWKACNYCSVLHAKIACNNCTWNHALTRGHAYKLYKPCTSSLRSRFFATRVIVYHHPLILAALMLLSDL